MDLKPHGSPPPRALNLDPPLLLTMVIAFPQNTSIRYATPASGLSERYRQWSRYGRCHRRLRVPSSAHFPPASLQLSGFQARQLRGCQVAAALRHAPGARGCRAVIDPAADGLRPSAAVCRQASMEPANYLSAVHSDGGYWELWFRRLEAGIRVGSKR